MMEIWSVIPTSLTRILLHYIHTIKLITIYIATDVATPCCTKLLITKIVFRASTFGVMVWLVKLISIYYNRNYMKHEYTLAI